MTTENSMIRKKTLAFALAGAFAMGSAAVVYAQSGQEAMGMMSMMQDCPMMMGMAGGPEVALRHAEALDLTPDQVEGLESLREEAVDTREAAIERMREIHQEIVRAAGESFDEAAAREAFGRMGDLHEEVGVTMLRARHRTSRALTAEQRDVLAELRSDRTRMMASMEGMGGMRGVEGMSGIGMMEMMKNCPMMRGGMGNGSAEEHGTVPHPEEGG